MYFFAINRTLQPMEYCFSANSDVFKTPQSGVVDKPLPVVIVRLTLLPGGSPTTQWAGFGFNALYQCLD
jgi:hypothetical protein